MIVVRLTARRPKGGEREKRIRGERDPQMTVFGALWTFGSRVGGGGGQGDGGKSNLRTNGESL